MEFALTFGSVGDIIQLCQLAIRLRRAIGAGCDAVGESAREYEELREELDTLVRILMQVVATYEQYESSPYLDGLDDVANKVVEQCFGHIKDALEHFQRRYHTSLHPGGSGSRIRDVFKKVEWTREHDRIKALRDKLRDGIQRLSLISNLVTEKTALVDQATMLARIDKVQNVVAQQSHDHTKILNLLRVEREASKHHTKKLEEVKAKLAAQTVQLEAQSAQLEETKQQLVQQNQASWSMFSVAKDALSGILEVKTLLVQVSQNVVNLHAVATNASVSRALDPTFDMPVMLEDALGRQMPIPSAWLETIQWDTLSMLLNDHFAGQKGHDMVQKRAYALEESVSGKDLDRSKPLHHNLRRGMRISMSMVFDDDNYATALSCPRCGAETIAEKGTTVYCYTAGCGMWWRSDKLLESKGRIQLVFPPYMENWRNKDTSPPIEESFKAEPGDFQRVRIQQHVPSDPSFWYCQTCNRAASNCTYGVTVVHDLVSVSLRDDESRIVELQNDQMDWKRKAKNEEMYRERLMRENGKMDPNWKKSSPIQFLQDWTVVWTPEQPPASTWKRFLTLKM